MANTDVNLTAEVTLDAAGVADTITFNNAPTALLVQNLDAAEAAWVTINGDTPVAQAADTFRIGPEQQKILKCPKAQQVVLGFIGDVDGTPTLYVERLRSAPGDQYVAG